MEVRQLERIIVSKEKPFASHRDLCKDSMDNTSVEDNAAFFPSMMVLWTLFPILCATPIKTRVMEANVMDDNTHPLLLWNSQGNFKSKKDLGMFLFANMHSGIPKRCVVVGGVETFSI
jgi:hypothetical protein